MTDFGRDTSCTTSLRTGRFVTGARLVAEADFRRLTTPRGTLRGSEEESNYGFDLMGFIGTTTGKTTAASLPGKIRSELAKDERHLSINVQVLEATDSAGLTSFDITIDAKTAAGPFTLTLRASAVTVELLGITVGG